MYTCTHYFRSSTRRSSKYDHSDPDHDRYILYLLGYTSNIVLCGTHMQCSCSLASDISTGTLTVNVALGDTGAPRGLAGTTVQMSQKNATPRGTVIAGTVSSVLSCTVCTLHVAVLFV